MKTDKKLHSIVSMIFILLFLGLMSATVTHAETYTFVTKWGSLGSGDGQFSQARDVAVDSSGNVYVADLGNNRIQKFDSNGTFITKWGSYGSGDGQFNYPYDVAVDSSGNVYVVDFGNHRIQKFDSNGAFITKWGSEGNGDGQFFRPRSLAIDSSGNVYVADTYNYRIQKFDSNGAFIAKWGSYGTNAGQLELSFGIAVDSFGNVYIADTDNHRVQKFDSNGEYITQWGSFGTGAGQFYTPFGVAVDSFGNVYIADVDNHRIQKFDSNGEYITQWGSLGTGVGQFNSLSRVAVDSSGNVYATDESRIQKFALEKITPTITWSNPADITSGTPLSSTQLNAIASVPGAFVYTPAEGTVLSVGTQTLHVDFTPEDTTNYNAVSADVKINVIIPPPTINSIVVPLDPVPVDTSIKTSADVTYLGDLSTLTAEWNWGDGSTSKSQGLSNFETSHVYNSVGIYTIKLTVTDAEGRSETKEAPNYVVIYDPQGGFVTGGGWINSPAGAYVPDKTLSGKATFGFVSKYEKGATVPTGETEFQFNVADLNFHSESYDWLVVAGSKAKYKGTGTINGEGNYGFMLSAVDGAVDKFRIKIWEKESGNTIYDNEMGAGEDSEPSTAISGGSIIVHKKK